MSQALRIGVVLASATAGSICATVTGFGIAIAFLMPFALLSTALGLSWTTEERQWLVATTAVISAAILTTSDFRTVPWPWVLHLLLPTLASAPLGIVCSLLLDPHFLLVGIGVLFWLLATQQLWDEWCAERLEEEGDRTDAPPLPRALPAWRPIPPTWQERAKLLLTGLVAGFMGGMSAMPGPPLKVYVVARPLPPKLARGAVSAYLLCVYLINLATLGAFLSPLVPLLGGAVGGVFLGLVAGGALLRLEPSPAFMNALIIGLLFVSCTSLLTGGEGDAGLGATFAILAAEAAWVSVVWLVFRRRYPPPAPLTPETSTASSIASWLERRASLAPRTSLSGVRKASLKEPSLSEPSQEELEAEERRSRRSRARSRAISRRSRLSDVGIPIDQINDIEEELAEDSVWEGERSLL